MNERIVCAANRNSEGEVVLGIRHHCELMNIAIRRQRQADVVWDTQFKEQGFVTNKGRFVPREEAWIIAEREGQIIRRVGGDTRLVDGVEVGVLYSENLY